jgi:hypothetical protein
VESVSQPLPVEPRDGPPKKSGPGIAPEARSARREVHPSAAISFYIATPAVAFPQSYRGVLRLVGLHGRAAASYLEDDRPRPLGCKSSVSRLSKDRHSPAFAGGWMELRL